MNPPLTRRSALQGTAALAIAQLASAPLRAATASGGPMLAGVNLAGAEFGNIPGVHGTEYLYPTRANVDYYKGLGFDLIRLPFKWERLQPQLGGPFAPTEQTLLTDFVRYATGAGMQVSLDVHNYAKRRLASEQWATERMIGSSQVPAQAFAEFWSALAALFRDNDRVLLGLMNEPAGIDARSWLAIVNQTIAAIRNTGANNLILVPGVDYTGAHSWLRVGNTAMAAVKDPANRAVIEVHQYFDGNSSGTKPESVSGTIGSERIEAFQTWAREHGLRAFLGEFNGGRNPASANALNDLLQEVTANPDVWMGWAAWAGGPRWPPDEMFNLEPWPDGREREQTRIVASYAGARPATAWVSPGATFDLDLARGRSHGLDGAASAFAGLDGDLGRKGLALSAQPALAGAADALLKQDRFTLVVEVRGLSVRPQPVDILCAKRGVWLRRAADGALDVPIAGNLRSKAQPLETWRGKRRIAIAVDRPGGRVAAGATGAAASAAPAQAPPDHMTLGAATAEGSVTRLTGYSRFVGPGELDALLA
jgi:endoglucanase